MTRFLFYGVILTLIYAIVIDSLAVPDLILGATMVTVLMLAFRKFIFMDRIEPIHNLPGRIWAFIPFVTWVAVDVIQSTWQVAWVVLGIRPMERSGFVKVPIGERTPTGTAVTALVTTLSPGSVLVDIDWEQEFMLFHYLDATEPDRIRERLQDFYQRYQRKVFP